MTKLDFLDSMKAFTEEVLRDTLCPVRVQNADEKEVFRSPAVYRMRMPDMDSSLKKAPYVLHQIGTGTDAWQTGERPASSVILRTVFCVYWPMEDGNPAEDEGALLLMNVMERWRIAVLQAQIVDERYRIDLRDDGMEAVFYVENTKPYYFGEYISKWEVPTVEWNDVTASLRSGDIYAGGRPSFPRK